MNTIVLMGEIASRPELRETKDGLAQASFTLRFDALKAEEPAYTVPVVIFGNAASEINAQFVQGDRVIIEGRLQMNSTTRPDGVREKRPEVIARRLHGVQAQSKETEFGVPELPSALPPLPSSPPPRATPTAATVPAPPRNRPAARPTPEPLDNLPF